MELNSFLKKYPLALPVAFLSLVILVPFWKLTTMQGYIITDDIFTSDIMNIGFPYRHFVGEAIKSGQLPFWLPHIFGGFPLLTCAGVFYPLNLILFGLLPSYIALNLFVLLILIIAAVGMFMYAREINASAAAALLAAISFAYSGFMMAHLKHDGIIAAVCLFPLGLYLIERSLKFEESEHRALQMKLMMMLSLVFGMQNLSGHIQTAYYSALMYGAYYLLRMRSRRKETRRQRRGVSTNVRMLLWFCGAMILGVGLSAIQILPTYELVSLSQRSGGTSFNFASKFTYDLQNWKMFFYPYSNGDIGNLTYRGEGVFWEDYGYVGLLTLLMAFYGAIKRWHVWHVKFFGLSAVFAYLLVLGPNTPLYETVFYLVPGMKYFRFPTRFLFVVDYSLSLLAAFGFDQIIASISSKKRRDENANNVISRVELLIVGVVIADLLFFQMRQNPIVDAKSWRTPPYTAQVLRTDTSAFRIYSLGASDVHKEIFARWGWEGNLQPYIDQREFLQPGSNVLYDISNADGYAPLVPNYVVDIWGDQNRSGLILSTAQLKQDLFIPRPAFLKILSMFNVKYILSAWPVRSDILVPMGTSASVHLYRNPSVIPCAWIVGKYRLAHSSKAEQAMILSDDFDPASEAILNTPPPFASEHKQVHATATIERRMINEVVISATADANALLILSDTFYPGWIAEVDGVQRPILQANICQRAVAISAGTHTIRFAYESPAVEAGATVSVVSLLLVIAGFVTTLRMNRTIRTSDAKNK